VNRFNVVDQQFIAVSVFRSAVSGAVLSFMCHHTGVPCRR